MKRMTFKDWCVCVGASAITLAVVVTVLYGIQAVVIDTGHAIMH